LQDQAHSDICFVFSHSLFLSLTPVAIAESDKIVIYFYSSESSINNFKSLKKEFDTYFSAFGPYEFQPVKKQQDFENISRRTGFATPSVQMGQSAFMPNSLSMAASFLARCSAFSLPCLSS